MSVPDAKTRNKISLNPSKVFSSSVPSRLLPRIALSNVCFVLSVLIGKEWLLELDVGVFWVLMRVLACGGFCALVWEGLTGQLAKRKNVEWLVIGMSSLFLFVQQACLFTAMFRLPSMRAIIFTQFSAIWAETVLNTSQSRKSLAVVTAALVSLASDAHYSYDQFWKVLPGYIAVLVHGLSSSVLEHTYRLLTPSLGITFTVAITTLGASAFALPFYVFRAFMLQFPSEPVLPLLSLAAIPFLAYSFLYLPSVAMRNFRDTTTLSRHTVITYPLSFLLAAIFGPLAFSYAPSWMDLIVASVLYIGMQPQATDAFAAAPRTPTSRLLKSYLKTILSNPESRRIFYFLMLNMCYMLVQMLYGIWTNSLGLISDAIHMAFDCMAIGVGLFASVMATWDPNERFTYGYGRIETLSGFANGIFLILISIFIIFEAIQRILDPPEMDTSQLLLVSSLGLAVNLFGMFAMGGHHHGHSHSHGHSHGHSHAHENHSHSHSSPAIRSSPTTPAHHGRTPHPHPHSHSHEDVHSHSHSRSENHAHSHSQDSHSEGHSHSHAHSEEPSHSDSESDSEDHSHSHSHSHSLNEQGQHSRTRSRPTSIQITPPEYNVSDSVEGLMANRASSPITPNYSFGHDAHFATHTHSEHTPNLHDHSHLPSHEGHSHNMRGVFLHVMADTLGSVGVIISTLLIQYYGWTGFDPIASLFIAILIAASVIPLVKDTGKILALDIDHRASSVERALHELESVEGVHSYDSPRFWPKDASTLIGSIHIQVLPSLLSSKNLRMDDVVESVDKLLRQKIPGLEELTIQVDFVS
uniref:Cation efflux protein transmembrane domain-containing protein n=1 Tax=Moniliophthora roreri TaxID=221103 RepID=A0A0W0FWX2_MONRR